MLEPVNFHEAETGIKTCPAQVAISVPAPRLPGKSHVGISPESRTVLTLHKDRQEREEDNQQTVAFFATLRAAHK
jgi:hypothetical protein